jgi:dihydroorotase
MCIPLELEPNQVKTEFIIREPDDFHVHLREGAMLDDVACITATAFRRALIMPNVSQPITTADDAIRYREVIRRATDAYVFEPLMTLYLTRHTTPEIVRDAQVAGVVAVKSYPPSLTTNSDLGVDDLSTKDDVLRTMEDVNMVLCIHLEREAKNVLNQEVACLPLLTYLATTYPRLRIVVEHVTTARMVRLVRSLGPNVAATMTVHHLFLTLADVIKGKIRPHNYCAPIAKQDADRAALRRAAMSGNSKFFLGTDSAPHLVERKECAEGCAGLFTAPVAMEALIELFEQYDKLDKLEAFTSEFGAQFYGLPLNVGKAVYKRQPWIVPEQYDGIRPFMASETLQFQRQG